MIQKSLVIFSMLLLLPSISFAQDITTGLVGYWTFDEGSGTSATDSSGNNNTGTLTNGPTWTTGKIGSALSFDGSDDYVDATNIVCSSLPCSISGWFKVNTLPSRAGIFRSNEDSNYAGVGIFTSDTGQLLVRMGDGVGAGSGNRKDYDTAANTITIGNWYHYTVVVNSITNVKVYVNGEEKSLTSGGGAASYGAGAGSTNIGRGWRDVTNTLVYVNGIIDDVRIYNRALSASDITALYNYTGGPPQCSDTLDNDSDGLIDYPNDPGCTDSNDPNETDPPPPDTQAPSTPTNLSATAVSSSQINLSWTASTDPASAGQVISGVTNYRLERCQGSSCTNFSQIAAPTGTSHTDTGLSANTTYRYRVRAADAAGNTSSYSAIGFATTQASGGGGVLGWTRLLNTKLRSVCAVENGFPEVRAIVGCEAITKAWNSAVMDTLRNRLVILGGGHADYYGNELYALNLSGTPSMTRLNDPTRYNPSGECVEQYPDGSVSSRHTYDGIEYIPGLDKMFLFGGSKPSCGFLARDTWLFDFSTLTWEPKSPSGDIPRASAGVTTAYDPNTGNIFLYDNTYLYSYDIAADRYQRLTDYFYVGYHTNAVIDPVRKKYVLMGNGSAYSFDITPGGSYQRQTINSSGSGNIIGDAYPGLAYDSVTNRIVAWSGGNTVYSLNAGANTWSSVAYANGPGDAMSNGTYGRWSYAPALDAFAYYGDVDEDAYLFRLSSESSIPPPSDTTSPTTSITAPSAGTTVSGTVTISANASDNTGVSKVEFYVDGAVKGSSPSTSSGQTNFSFVWDTTNGGTHACLGAHTHTLSAKAYDASNNVGTSANVLVNMNDPSYCTTAPPPSETVTVSSGKAYQTGTLTVGTTVYIDRAFTYSTIPSAYLNATVIKTANDDKSSTDSSFLSFSINQNASVYVAHDTRLTTKPAWLSTFTDTGTNLVTTDTTLRLYRKDFAQGTVTLGGNSGVSASSMYTVVVMPTSGSVPSTKFQLNDRAQVSSGQLNVRSSPSTSATILGTQATGALGAVIGGPTAADGFNWWQIDYDLGADGWSVEDFLVKVTASSDTTPPSTPTNLSASAVSSSQINLSWTASTDNVGVTGYRVERCQGSTCTTFTQIATPTTTSYNDTGLTANTTYRYRVRATDVAGNLSGYSSIVNVTTQASSGEPAPNPTLTNIPDNTALDLGSYTCIPPAGSTSCTSITDYSGFTYDAPHHQMLMFGGGHSATFRDDVDVFNFTNLTWGSAYAPTPCSEMTTSNLDSDKGAWITTNHPFSRHAYDLIAVAENTREFLLLRAGGGSGNCETGPTWYPTGRVGHYDIEKKTWSFGASMANTWSNLGAAEYDPVSGMVIVVDAGSLWTYDPEARTATKRISHGNSSMSYAQNLVYYPPNQKMYYIVGNGAVFEVTLNRSNFNNSTITQMTGITGSIPSVPETGWAYDSANQIIGGGVYNGTFYAFNPLTKTWTSKTIQSQSSSGKTVGTVAFHALDYNPINNVFIFITRGSSYTVADRVWAYRYAGGGGSTLPSSDTTSPTTSLTAPSAGTTVSGTVTISANASDNTGVTKVEFFVDGAVKGSSPSTSSGQTNFSFVWDTTNGGTHACNGAHTHVLTTRAYDAVENIGLSASVTVNMNNPTYCTAPSPSTKFAIGDRVQVSSGPLNVRQTPSAPGTLLGTQAISNIGTVIGGPTAADGFNWWNINYDSGVDGWSAEDFLTKYTTPPPTGSQITSFQLTAGTSGILPFTVGLGFKKGDITGTPILDIPDQQVIIKRRWNDGSVKHAIVSGHTSLSAGTPKIINVVSSTASSRTNLTTADIQAANPQASVQLGSIGTVNLSSLLATPFRTWISGPEMVEAHYQSNVGNDPTLQVWFYVRLYKNGRMWVRTVIENGYLDITTSDKTYAPVVIIGGSTIYNNGGASLTHYAHTRWTQEGWIGGDPQITPKHDTAYLINSRLVPNYAKRNPSQSVLNGLYQTYDPMQKGGWTERMGNAGFQNQIGILPLWDALYINSGGDARAYKSVLANANALNSYGIVWNDSITKLPTMPSNRPTWTVNGPNAGGESAIGAGSLQWDFAHHGSGGYLAYLVTGDHYYLETMENQSATCYLVRSSTAGSGTSRIVRGQTRGAAWCQRTIGQLAGIGPPGPIVNDYQALLANNADHWNTVRLTPDINGLGYLYEYGANGVFPYGPGLGSPWMQHFFIQSYGHVSDLEPLSDMSAWNAVRNHLYKAIVGILGPVGTDNYCYTKASSYTLKFSAGDDLDPTTWYDTWGQVYQGTHGISNTSCEGTLEGSSGGAPSIAGGYWGNLLPAIAYAVDHGAPGAQTTWSRLTAADNWSALDQSGFDDIPIWGIYPRDNQSLPSPQPLTGDLNGDRTVNALDWGIMSAVWFTSNAQSDLNSDGIVNSIDFSLLNANWGRTL